MPKQSIRNDVDFPDSVVKELRSRFAHFHETGDDSKIPADLQRVTYRIAVQHGGEKEYEAIKKVSMDHESYTLLVRQQLYF